MRFEKETNLYQDAAIANKFSSQDTQFNVVNGKISYLISDSDIEEYEDKSKTVTSRLNSSEDSIGRHSRQISSLQTDIVGINGNIDTFKSEVNTFEQTTNSTISSITSTVATKTQVWTVQPTVPYLANDFWIRDNVLYVCTVSRAIGSFNASDWKPATKGRIFTSEPTPPYYSGDAWMQGDTGEILFCNATRLTGDCNIDDWKKASKYTDDSAFNNWTQNTYNSFIEQLPSQINLQVTGSREIDANTKYTSKASIIATINDQTFESGVRINADRITLDGDATINAINGATGTVVVNANKVNLNAYATFTALKTAGSTEIDGANIITGSLNASKITGETITADEIKGGTITGDKIATDTITANNIAAATITGTEIASKTITADNIAVETITADRITTGTITADRIAMETITADRIKGSTITGDKIAGETITASNIKSSTITSSQIAAGTIKSSNIEANTIKASNIALNTITADRIATETITADRIKGSTITGDKIASETITADNIKTGTITANEIKGSTITGSQIASKTITADNIAVETITADRIATGTITADKLSAKYLTSTDVGSSGSTTISGSRITTGTISGKNNNVVFDVANGSLTMNNGSINIGSKFIVNTDGSVTMKSATITGYLKPADIGDDGSTTISGNRITTGTIAAERLDLSKVLKVGALNNYPTKDNLKTLNGTEINGANITTGTIKAERLDLSGVLKVGALNDYATKSSLGSYALKSGLSNGTTTIDGACISTGTISASRLDLSGVLKVGALNDYATKSSLNSYATKSSLDSYALKSGLSGGTTTIDGACISTGTISASRLDLSGVLKVGALNDYATKSSLNSYATKSSLKDGTTTISGGCITTGIIQSSDKDVIFNLTSGILTMNYGSINIGKGVFQVTTSGALTATNATIGGSIVNKANVSGQLPIATIIDNGKLTVKANSTTIGRFYCGWVSTSVNKTIMLESASPYYTDLMIKVGNKGISISSDGTSVGGSFSVSGTKNRFIKTKNYDERLYYSYETPSPLFGDVGNGTINQDGKCYIVIEPAIYETIQTSDYQVFLQKYGTGDCYVSERHDSYFIVSGTPGLLFAWELKAKQIDWNNNRLNTYTMKPRDPGNSVGYKTEAEDYLNEKEKTDTDYGADALEHIENLYTERITQ